MYSREDIIKGKKSNILVSGQAQEEKPKVPRTLSEAEQKNKKIIEDIWSQYSQIKRSMVKNQNWEDIEPIYEWNDESVVIAETKLKECQKADEIWKKEKEDIKYFHLPPEPDVLRHEDYR